MSPGRLLLADESYKSNVLRRRRIFLTRRRQRIRRHRQKTMHIHWAEPHSVVCYNAVIGQRCVYMSNVMLSENWQ